MSDSHGDLTFEIIHTIALTKQKYKTKEKKKKSYEYRANIK